MGVSELEISKLTLTHLSLASHKRDIGEQCRPRSDNAVSDQGLHCLIRVYICINSEISTKHDTNKN